LTFVVVIREDGARSAETHSSCICSVWILIVYMYLLLSVITYVIINF